MTRGSGRRSGAKALAATFWAVAAALAVGCRGPLPPRDPRPLRVVMAPEMQGVDPHRQTAHGGISILSNVFESLTAFDADMHVEPALAARWENPDDLTWRFHLRQGVRFHDGRPLGAADVVASLERARRPGRSSQGSLGVIREVRAPSPDVVEVRTWRPSLMLLNNLASAFVVPADAPEEITSPVGTGPYRFAAFDPERGLDLEAWSGYWGRKPAVGKVSFLFEPDPGRRLGVLASGAADVALRLAETAVSPAAGAGYRVVWRLAPGVRVLGLRVDRPPFSDPRLRRAVNLAIDRGELASRLLADRAVPLGQLLPPEMFGHAPDLGAQARDLLAARRLVEELPTSERGIILDHGQGRQEESAAIGAQLREAGLEVAQRQRAVTDLLPSLDAGSSQMVLLSYIYSAGDTDDFFESVLHSRDPARGYGADNRFGYVDPQVDAAIESAAAAGQIRDRLAEYQRAARLAMRDLPIVPLW